jgi:hypothetical protein
MDNNDLLAVKALTDICEAMLAFQVAQVKAIEATTLRFQHIERMMRICAGLLNSPDVHEKKPIIEQLVSLAEATSGLDDGDGLFDGLARLQSDQERLESYLAQLRVYLNEKGIG